MIDPSTRYLSGEEIRAGDHIRLAGRMGYIEFVLGPDTDPSDWYKTEFGKGFMLNAEGMGNVFMRESDEDLEFIRRR
jgi:hypothetical protein